MNDVHINLLCLGPTLTSPWPLTLNPLLPKLSLKQPIVCNGLKGLDGREIGEKGFRHMALHLTYYLFRVFICIVHFHTRCQLHESRTGNIWCLFVVTSGGAGARTHGLNHTEAKMPQCFIHFRLASSTEL